LWTSLRNCASFGFWSRRPAGSPFGASCWSLCSGLDPLLNRGWCESMRELKNQTFFNYLAVTSFLLQFSWSSSLFLALIITNGLCLGGRKAWAACRLYALCGFVLVTCLPIVFIPFLFLLRACGAVVVSGGEGKQIEALRVPETNHLV